MFDRKKKLKIVITNQCLNEQTEGQQECRVRDESQRNGGSVLKEIMMQKKDGTSSGKKG